MALRGHYTEEVRSKFVALLLTAGLGGASHWNREGGMWGWGSKRELVIMLIIKMLDCNW